MRWWIRRLGFSVFVVWVVVSVAFAVNNLVPGDPARMVAGAQARPADVARIRTQLGLDRPLLERYGRFWARLVHLGPATVPKGDATHGSCGVVVSAFGSGLHVDLGRSYQMGQPIVDLVATRLPRTFALALVGLLLQVLFGVVTGTLAATRRGSWLDRAVVGASVLGVSVPTFLIALLLQWTLAQGLGWLPVDGFGKTFADHARCIVLPALTLGIYGAAYYTRLTRDELVVLLRQDFIRTARAKGVGEIRVVRHALRNALLPLVTTAGLDFGALLGGAVVTEQIFRWPGVGQLAVTAMLNRDGPLILGSVVVSSVAIVGSNLAVDALQARLDPRVRVQR